MKRFCILFLRLLIVFLLLLPILIPKVTKKNEVTVKQNIVVLVQDGVLITPEIKSNLLNLIQTSSYTQQHWGVKKAGFDLEWQTFGHQKQSPIDDYEQLLNLLQNLNTHAIIVSPAALWGPAAVKFQQRLQKNNYVLQGNVVWISPTQLKIDQSQKQTLNPINIKKYLTISEFYLPSRAFLGQETITNVHIIGKLTPSQTEDVDVSLYGSGTLLTSHHYKINSDAQGIVNVTLKVPLIFNRPHTQTMTAVLGHDLAKAPLNTASTTVAVFQPKSTLLHLAVGPDWATRHFRQKLKSWPNLELISYYILRDPNKNFFIPNDQLALIPFPVEKLFDEDLPHFHGVILQNFNIDQYLKPQQIQNLIDYIKSGGRLLIMPGPLSFLNMDEGVGQLFPCLENTRYTQHDQAKAWTPADDLKLSDLFLVKALTGLFTQTQVQNCSLKPTVRALAYQKEGNTKEPLLLTMPLNKGLILTFLSSDWHTRPSSEDLFEWTVEFLQRRQDGGLRAPDMLGPRLYSEENTLLVRSRGAAWQGKLILDVDGLQQETNLETLHQLNLEVLRTSRLPLAVVDSDKNLQNTDLFLPSHKISLQTGPEQAALRNVEWPIFSGTMRQNEVLENPIIFSKLPDWQTINNTEVTKQNQTKQQNDTEQQPILLAYPFLLFLVLSLLALEQFLLRKL